MKYLNFGFLFTERVLAAISKVIFVFYLSSHDNFFNAKDFFLITTQVTLFFVLCHLGTENLLIGLKSENKNISHLFDCRFIGCIISIILCIPIIFYYTNFVVALVCSFIFLGVALPIKQITAIAEANSKEIFYYKSLPEYLGSIFRIYIVLFNEHDLFLLIFSFYFAEICAAFINIKYLNRFFSNKNWLKDIREIIKTFKANSKIIALSMWGILSLFLFQRGDVFIATHFDYNFNASLSYIIKFQQIFDSSSIFSYAFYPYYRYYFDRPKNILMIVFVFSFMLFIAAELLLNILSVYDVFMMDKIAEIFDPKFIPIGLFLGSSTYFFHTYISVRQNIGLANSLIFLSALIKIIIFMNYNMQSFQSYYYGITTASMYLFLMLIGMLKIINSTNTKG